MPTDRREGLHFNEVGEGRYYFPNPVVAFGHMRDADLGGMHPENTTPPFAEFQGIVQTPHWF